MYTNAFILWQLPAQCQNVYTHWPFVHLKCQWWSWRSIMCACVLAFIAVFIICCINIMHITFDFNRFEWFLVFLHQLIYMYVHIYRWLCSYIRIAYIEKLRSCKGVSLKTATPHYIISSDYCMRMAYELYRFPLRMFNGTVKIMAQMRSDTHTKQSCLDFLQKQIENLY